MTIAASFYGVPKVVPLAAPTLAQLQAAILNAKANTLIDITSPGEVGELVLTGVVKPQPGVVVRSPPGQLMSVRLQNSAGISFYGGTFSAKRISSSLTYGINLQSSSRVNIFGAMIDDVENCVNGNLSTDVRLEDIVFANNRKDMMQLVECSRFSIKRNRGTQSAKGYSTVWFPNGRQPEFAKSQAYATAQGGWWVDGPHAEAGQWRGGAFDFSVRDNYIVMDGAGFNPFGARQTATREAWRRVEIINNFMKCQQQNLYMLGADLKIVGNTLDSLYDYDNSPGMHFDGNDSVAGGEDRVEAWGNTMLGFCTVRSRPPLVPNLEPTASTFAASNSSSAVVPPEAPRGLLIPWVPRPARPADPSTGKPETVVAPETLWDGVTTSNGAVTDRSPLTPGKTMSLTRGQTKTFGYASVTFEHKFERAGVVIQSTNAYVVKNEDPGLGPITGFVRAITDGGVGEWAAGQPYQPVAA